MDRRRIHQVLLKLGMTAGVMALLVNLVGWDKVIVMARETELPWLMALLSAVLAVRCIEAVQMRVLLAKLDLRISVFRIFLANALSALYSLVVPGDVIASVAKWADLSAATGRKSLILSAIVYNRIALLVPVLGMGTVALAIENPFADSYIVGVLMLVGILIVALALGLFHPTLRVYGAGLCRWLTSPFPPRIHELVERVLASLEGFREFLIKDHLVVYGFSLLSLLTNVAVVDCATRAMAIELSPLVLFWVTAVLIAARQVPVTVSNLGVREGILIVVLELYGVEPERAMTMGLLLFSGQLLVAIIGLMYQLALSLGLARWDNSFEVQATCPPA